MRIAILGAEGQVGGYLLRELASRHAVWGTSQLGVQNMPALDIRDRAAVERYLENLRPEYVVLAAALTHVDYCEEHPDEAEASNVRGTEHVAQACHRLGAGLTFFSSDYVFDGQAGPYREEDATHPLSVYGHTKLEGERLVADLVPNHLIVRTMVVYSYLPGSVNLFMQLLTRARENQPITQPGDQMVNPTQAVNLARAIGELLDQGRTGIYHLAGTTLLSREAFARAVLQKLGFDPASVSAVTTAELKQKAPRPLRSGLLTDKAQAVLQSQPLWDLDQALSYTVSQMPGEE